MSEPLTKYKNLEQAQVFDQYGVPVYGMDLELLQKQQGKHDPEKQALVQGWIEEVTGTRFPGDFQSSLKDGVLLCKLINAVKPGSVGKINTAKMPFMQMENVSNFLKAAEALGLQKHDSFMTIDLFEGKNIPQVVNSLFMFASIATQKVPGYKGPKFGLAIVDKKEIKFTEEQLRNARAEVTGGAVASIKIDTGKSIGREVVKTKETGTSGTTFMSTGSVKTGLEGKSMHRDIVKTKESGDTSVTPLHATASMKVDTGKSISNEVVKIKEAPKPASSSPSASSSLVEDLEKLANLRDKGILTEAEFQAKKKQLLGL